MSPTARVGVVGLGHWGPNLARNFAAHGALAALADSRAEVLARFGAQYSGARTFADFDSLLATKHIDAVAIATPAATHGALVAKALAAGKHVFVEKPLCLDLSEARRLDAEARARGLILMIGHLLLYHPAFLALKTLVESGRIGLLRYIYSNRLSLGKIRREENALWSFAPHDVSMILSLTGTLPERAITSGGNYLLSDVADTTLSHLSFPGGVQAHIFVSWLHPYKDHRLVVVGSEGMATFHDSESEGRKLLFYPHAVGWNGDLPAVTKATGEAVPYGAGEPLALECRHFLDCVAERRAPRSDAAESLRVLAVLDACQRSLVSGQPVALGRAP
jgi:UDP-2-acetamido-3-amino-2,3-dideoxy-glucuronate N-acetyltransferase